MGRHWSGVQSSERTVKLSCGLDHLLCLVQHQWFSCMYWFQCCFY